MDSFAESSSFLKHSSIGCVRLTSNLKQTDHTWPQSGHTHLMTSFLSDISSLKCTSKGTRSYKDCITLLKQLYLLSGALVPCRDAFLHYTGRCPSLGHLSSPSHKLLRIEPQYGDYIHTQTFFSFIVFVSVAYAQRTVSCYQFGRHVQFFHVAVSIETDLYGNITIMAFFNLTQLGPQNPFNSVEKTDEKKKEDSNTPNSTNAATHNASHKKWVELRTKHHRMPQGERHVTVSKVYVYVVGPMDVYKEPVTTTQQYGWWMKQCSEGCGQDKPPKWSTNERRVHVNSEMTRY